MERTQPELLRITQTVSAICRVLVDDEQFRHLAERWPLDDMPRVTKKAHKELDNPVEY